jgi:hypothetical protein
VSEENDVPDELAEAREARALADALEGRADSPVPKDALEIAAKIAAARAPELDATARDRLADDLFGALPAIRRPARWPLALAATVLVAVSAALVARDRLALQQVRRDEQAQAHAAAEALVAALLPGDPAERAQAIAEGAAP